MKIKFRTDRSFWSAPIRRPPLPGDELLVKKDEAHLLNGGALHFRGITREEFERDKARRKRADAIEAEAERWRNVWWRRFLRRLFIWG